MPSSTSSWPCSPPSTTSAIVIFSHREHSESLLQVRRPGLHLFASRKKAARGRPRICDCVRSFELYVGRFALNLTWPVLRPTAALFHGRLHIRIQLRPAPTLRRAHL